MPQTGNDIPKEIEQLKRFLIFRLLLVMIFLIATEGVINLLFGRIAMPVLNEYFGAQLEWGTKIFDSNIFVLLRLGLYTVIVGVVKGLPFGAGTTIQLFLNKYLIGDVRLSTEISGSQKFLLLMMLVVILGTFLLPYLVAILYYSGVVVKKMEEIRAYDKQQREEFTKKRNLLLSDITHDLKTPITTMAGYAQALNDGMVTDPVKQRRYLQAIRTKSLQMSELITMLFHYVKMDSEGFTIKREKSNLSELCLRVAAGAFTDIEEAGMDLDVDIPDEPFFADLDNAQFTRALTNLVTNAIRHNDAGTMIKVSITPEPGAKVIRVSDSGNPIEASILDTIFEPFVMGDESRNRRGGSGLGLSVTRKIIELHDGTIYVEQPTESPYTKAFCVRLPIDDYDYK